MVSCPDDWHTLVAVLVVSAADVPLGCPGQHVAEHLTCRAAASYRQQVRRACPGVPHLAVSEEVAAQWARPRTPSGTVCVPCSCRWCCEAPTGKTKGSACHMLAESSPGNEVVSVEPCQAPHMAHLTRWPETNAVPGRLFGTDAH